MESIGNFQFVQGLTNITEGTLDNSIKGNTIIAINNIFNVSAGDKSFAYGINVGNFVFERFLDTITKAELLTIVSAITK